jgi:hypothetical protein
MADKGTGVRTDCGRNDLWPMVTTGGSFRRAGTPARARGHLQLIGLANNPFPIAQMGAGTATNVSPVLSLGWKLLSLLPHAGVGLDAGLAAGCHRGGTV